MLIRAENELNRKIDYNDCYLIGDSFSDVIAGQNFGCKTILFNSNPREIPEKLQPDFLITSISHLLGIIK